MKGNKNDKYAETRPITSTASSSASSGSSDFYKTSPYQAAPIAPDGGWGWVVCGASFMCMVIMDGMLFTYGVFFMEFLDYFGAGKGETALVGSVFMGMSMFFGPFASTMVNLWGLRVVSIAGSVLAAVAFACSVFAPNLEVLTFTYGVMGGMGVAMTYVSSVLVVGFYFDKRRALANGITSSGSGIGTFIFSPLCTYLIEQYSWKGALLILSAITLNCVIFSALYRPLKAVKTVADIDKKIDTLNKNIDYINRTNSLDKNSYLQLNSTKSIPIPDFANVALLQDNDKSKSSSDIRKTCAEQSEMNLARFVQTKQLTEMLLNNQQMNTTTDPTSCHNIYALSKPVVPVEPFAQLCHSTSNVHHRRIHTSQKQKHVTFRPLDKKDIFYSGSLLRIANRSLKEKEFADDFDAESINDEEKCCNVKAMKRSFMKVTGIHLLANPVFLLIVFASVLWTTHSTILTILPHYSMQQGASTTEATTILSVIGISNTVGRLLVGWVSCKEGVNVEWLNISALLIGGCSCLMMPFIPNYIGLVIMAVIFGCCMATWTSLRPIILVELMGVNNLTNSFGLVAMFQGLAFSVGPPVAGILHDLTLSYKLPFLLAGGAFITSGCVYIITSRLVAYINNKGNIGCINYRTKKPCITKEVV